MPFNAIVRDERYEPTATVAGRRDSAFAAVRHLLEPISGLGEAHRRELLSIGLWKWTEAAGVAPNAKYNLRYATPAALDRNRPAKIAHEHVWTRRWLIDRLLAPGKSWSEEELRKFLETYGIGCVVTVAEHGLLSDLPRRLEGWARYREVGLQVRDLASVDGFDLARLNPPSEESSRRLASSVLSSAVPASPAAAADVGATLAQRAGVRAPLLSDLVRTAELADAVGVVTFSRGVDREARYVRIHDASLPDPTPAAAYLHWSGRVSLALSADDVPARLVESGRATSTKHPTYGVEVKVTDHESLGAAQELLVEALQKVRSGFEDGADRREGPERRGVKIKTGHVFVIQGQIGNVVADASIISTDANFRVEPPWHGVLGDPQEFDAADHRPSSWGETGWGRSRTGTAHWFVDVTAADTGGMDAFGRLEAVLIDVATDRTVTAAEGRVFPLVLVPVIGTKGGGYDRQRGDRVRRLVQMCQRFVEKHPVDVAIVTRDSSTLAGLQHQRQRELGAFLDDVEMELAKDLGARARDGSLALFIGAGTSIPAGAPSWTTLLEALGAEARLSPEVTTGMANLTALDKAELLHAQLGDEGMGRVVAREVGDRTPALSHVLLANLGCQAAVTTNYDRLYESAIRSSGGVAAVVLPNEVPPTNGHWLLKLHGDVEAPTSIVLTRSQFVGFNGAFGPAGAVLQGLLLTKHLLVVGTSMSDDNLLRLIYEVGAYRDRVLDGSQAARTGARSKVRPKAQFGTILSLSDDAARRQLYEPYFSWDAMSGGTELDRARQLEIFLDAVAMFAADDSSWLLDERFSDLLGNDDDAVALADDARALASRAARRGVTNHAWHALTRALNQLGSSSEQDLIVEPRAAPQSDSRRGERSVPHLER